MDILELSKKMEANLLETFLPKSHLNNLNLNSRLTRSQTNSLKPPAIIEEEEEEEEEMASSQVKKTRKVVDDVEKIYLCKKSKVVRKKLETIFEDPLWKRGNAVLLGASKIKRSIYLDREFRITSKQKSKLRKMKIKKLGKKVKFLKMTDDEFKDKMSRIENYINEDVSGSSNGKDCSEVQIENKKEEQCGSQIENTINEKCGDLYIEERNDTKDIKMDDCCFVLK